MAESPRRPDPRRKLGAAGERLAADQLERSGYEIVERNVRRREGEVDLVAVDRRGAAPVLVFVEVKVRRPRVTGGAVESLSARQQERLRGLAEAYAAEHAELPADLRIDLVAIDLASDGSVAGVRHVESAVEG
jgi:putative endonuclease